MVIDTKSETTILLWRKQHQCSIGEYRRLDVAMLKHVLNLFLCLLELEWAELVDWPVNGWSVVLKFDLELMYHSYRWQS